MKKESGDLSQRGSIKVGFSTAKVAERKSRAVDEVINISSAMCSNSSPKP